MTTTETRCDKCSYSAKSTAEDDNANGRQKRLKYEVSSPGDAEEMDHYDICSIECLAKLISSLDNDYYEVYVNGRKTKYDS